MPRRTSSPSLATTNLDARASFSNYGVKTVHLGAPGVMVLSTIRNGEYAYASGTSMATPHVSGAGALVLSHCALNTSELKDTLVQSVDRLASLATLTISGGRLNVRRAIDSCSAPPSAPASLSAFAGDKQVRLAWTAGTNATSYRVKRGTTPGGPYTARRVERQSPAIRRYRPDQRNDLLLRRLRSEHTRRERTTRPKRRQHRRFLPTWSSLRSAVPAAQRRDRRWRFPLRRKTREPERRMRPRLGSTFPPNGVLDSGDIRLDEVQNVPSLGPGIAATVSDVDQYPVKPRHRQSLPHCKGRRR